MLSDLRLTVRSLAKSPAFVIIAVLTLGLGLGVNTAMFSIVNGIALRGLPVPDQKNVLLVVSQRADDPNDRSGLSWAEFEEYRAQQQALGALGAYTSNTATVSGPGGDPERVDGSGFTAAVPVILQAPIEHGRWFTADDDRPGAAPTVVLSHQLWQNRFKADPGVIGKQLKVNGAWSTVVGVAPADFRFPEQAALFFPLRDVHRAAKRTDRFISVIGRLRPDATLAQAQAELAATAKRFQVEHAEDTKGVTFQLQRIRDAFVDPETRLLLGVMLAAVCFVLLIACANVANLLLTRAALREKEIAVRSALGAARSRIVRLLLTESLVLTAGGTLLGLGLAQVGVVLFRNNIADLHPPYWMVFTLDAPAMVYTAGLALITCVLAGLYPALRTSRTDLNAVLKDGGRGSTNFSLGRFTRLMVIGEVAMSCLLLVLSGLMIRTVLKMQSAPLGFETAGIFHGRVALLDEESKGITKQRVFFRQIEERLRTRPEIASFGLVDSQPTFGGTEPVIIDGRAPDPAGARGPMATVKAVSPGYLPTLGITLLSGRQFTDADNLDAPAVAVISTVFAEKYWPNQSPLGRRFRRGAGKPGETVAWITVVGVIRQTMQGRFNNDVTPQAYVPYQQVTDDLDRMSIFARARGGDPALLAPVLRAAVREVRDDLPIYFAQTMPQMLAEAQASKKLIAWLFGVFGAVAFGLAAIGLYGVMSYSVSHRTQEIGVRVALGATPGDVLGLIFRQGGWQLGLGLAIGLGLAFFAGQVLATFLYGVSPHDGVTFTGTLLALGVAGLLAMLVPALRALRVNPVVALRNE